jgi:hypothetical protein
VGNDLAGAGMGALIDELVLRTAWLLTVTSVVLGIAAHLHPSPIG